jgi:nucleotide-binding universal stress UspA family protein
VSVLFGVDDSEAARQAVAALALLLGENRGLQITLFHGAPDPERSSLAKVLRLTPEDLDEYLRLLRLQKLKALEQARTVLVQAGLADEKVAVHCKPRCTDPARDLLKFAVSEGFDTIALARSRAPRPERLLLGSVPYRLVHLSDEKAVCVIDAPVASHDVLVTLVGAPISRRVMDYSVRYFSHLRQSKFTFLHVIPPAPPVDWSDPHAVGKLKEGELDAAKAQWMKKYEGLVEQIAAEGKERLLKAGVREENVAFKVQPARKGMARDILVELAWGNYGVLVMGRKGSKDISKFELGGTALKVLENAGACMVCLVS